MDYPGENNKKTCTEKETGKHQQHDFGMQDNACSPQTFWEKRNEDFQMFANWREEKITNEWT